MGETPSFNPIPAGAPVAYTFALQPPLDIPTRLVPGWRERLAEVPGISDVRVRAEEVRATVADGAYGYLMLVSGIAADRAAMLPGPPRARQSALRMSSTRSLASPKSIAEFSRKNSGFCTPA
jgi:hypothetical protein